MRSLFQEWVSWFIVLLIGSLTSRSLKAQTIYISQNVNLDTSYSPSQLTPTKIRPPSSSPTLPEIPPKLPPSPEELLPSPSVNQPSGMPSTTEAIIVTEFKFTGNTALSLEELAKTTTGLVKKPLPLSRLLQIASEVAQLYAERGYSTSGAIISIPKSTREQGTGVVEIQVIEGVLEEIKVISTAGRLNPDYVRSRLALAASKPFKVNQLQEALQLLQLDPLISGISATLSAGSQPGQSILEVMVKEAPSFNLQIIADNNRSPSIGSFQRGGSLNEDNLLGWGDKVSLIYTNTDGSNGIDFSYTVPLNPRNGTIRFNYNYIDNQVIEPPLKPLDIESESSYYQITLRQPIIQTINQQTKTFQEVALGLTGFWRESQSLLLDIPFPLTLGADDQGRTRIFALRLLTEWTRQNAKSVLALRSEMSWGLDAFGSTINDPIPETKEVIPDSRFFIWRGQAQWVRVLAAETLLVVRGNMQLADDTLFPSETLSIGGFGSVRGYRQNALLTDNGFSASTEVRLPILKVPEWQGVLQLIPFVDYGIGWNSAGLPNPDPQSLASVGIGLQWRQGDNFTARFDWGIPLVDIDSRKRTWQENGLLFSIQWNPF